MAVTCTENLHLGMQLDKTDFLDWDAITDNWRKIDAAYGGQSGGIGKADDAILIVDGIAQSIVGIASDFEEV